MFAEDTVVVPLSKSKIVLIMLGAVAFVALGIALLLISVEKSPAKALYMQLAGAASILFFGLVFLFAVRKVFDTQPGLIVSSQGILDNSSGVAAGMIPWAEIQGFATTTVHSQRFLTILVAEPEKYVERGGFLKRVANRASLKYYGSPVQISANSLKIRFDDLAALVERRYQAHRQAQAEA
jgi:hypothetical protein